MRNEFHAYLIIIHTNEITTFNRLKTNLNVHIKIPLFETAAY